MSQQPRSPESPIALQGRNGDAESFGALRFRQTGEETQLNYTGSPRIELFQFAESIVKFEQILLPVLRRAIHRGQRHFDASTASLFGVPVPGMVHQDPPQLLSGYRKEMGPVLPLHRFRFEQAKKHLMDKGRRLECMVRTFAAQVVGGQTAQFLIHRLDQFAGCALIAFAPAGQQSSNGFPVFRHECVTDYQVT
jgi:hypothetical protein